MAIPDQLLHTKRIPASVKENEENSSRIFLLKSEGDHIEGTRSPELSMMGFVFVFRSASHPGLNDLSESLHDIR